MKKLKRFSIVIAFTFLFTCYGQLPWQPNEQVYADPITGAAILSAGGTELLIAAAPYVLAGVLIAGAAYGSYKLTKAIKRHYLESKAKSIQGSLSQSQIDALNTMGQAYINSPSTFNLDVNSLPKGVLQTYGNSFTQTTDYLNNLQTNTLPFYQLAQPISDSSFAKVRTFLKQYNLEVDIVSVTDYGKYNTSTNIYDVKTTATGIDALRTKTTYHIYNPVNNQSFDKSIITIATLSTILYSQSSGFTDVWTYATDGSSNNINYSYNINYYLNLLANVIGIQSTVIPTSIFQVVGDGSICVYPRVVQDTCKSVDVPATIAAVPYATSQAQDVVSVPTSVPAENTVSVPIDTPYTDSVPTTPDTTAPDYTVPDNVSLDFTPFFDIDLTKKFPFSIPWDILRSFKSLAGISSSPPKWTLDFSMLPASNANNKVVIDFSMFEKLAMVVRWGLLLIFNIGLIIKTREIIRG